MAYTIAVAGKGGVGKTTLCGLLIQYLCEKDEGPVLAVDADANSNLNEVLGVDVEVTLGQIVDLLYSFKESRSDLSVPDMSDGFTKRLYANYLSYLPADGFSYKLKMNKDDRGSFTEILRTADRGQVSVNISKPGITKGQHWHHTKWEFFIVVSGHGLIQQRKYGTDEVIEFEVSGEKIEAVHMLPGYTHNIINLSETENLVTVMWANEIFDPNRPDTFFELVK